MSLDLLRPLRRLAPGLLRWPGQAASLVLVTGVLLSAMAGELNRQNRISLARTQIESDLSDFRARLESRVYASVSLTRGLAADLVIRQDMAAPEFAGIAEQLKRNDPYIRAIAMAPDFVISDVYPRAGNEDMIGLNLLLDTEQKGAMLRAISLDDAVLAGPFPLRQGGTGLAGRVPVWLDKEGVPHLWGATTVMLDYPKLMEDSGIGLLEKNLWIDILGQDAAGPAGNHFYGDREAYRTDAVKMPIFVPGGSWLVSAYPREGWYHRPWWLTTAGLVGLAISLLSSAAVFRILYDRQRIRHLAGVDVLTGLPNRRQAMAYLSRLMTRSQRSEERFAVLSLDLNGFKPINDNYGHAAGDRLLEEIGERLNAAVRPGDLVARIGGDEFLMLIGTEVASRESVRPIALRLQDAIKRPVELDGHSVSVGVSIGIACYPDDGLDEGTLLRQADEAMYRAKRAHASGIAFAGENEVPESRW